MFFKLIARALICFLSIGIFSGSEFLHAQTLYGSAGSLQERENAHNADWAYNWANTPTNRGVAFSTNVANYEYVPMIWSASVNGVGGQINTIRNLENNFGVHVDYVLGFNEPELSSQSNMTVNTALDVWQVMTDEFADTDIQLVSPAVSGQGGLNNWLYPFMDTVVARNNDSNANNDLKVDAIAYHFYTVGFNGTNEANRLLDQIDEIYDRYGLPIWITEFAGTSFSADNPVHSFDERQAFNREFLERLIPQFDARDYVHRVSWWQFGAGVSGGGGYSRLSTVSNGVYTPSIIGEVYLRTTLDEGETYEFGTREHRPTYVHYLRGSHLANNGPDLEEALRAVDVMEGTTNMSGTGDFGFEDADDGFIRIRDGATLNKLGNNTVTVPGSPIFNDGSMLISSGTLLLKGGSELTGTGELLVSDSGTLATSSEFGVDEVILQAPTISINSGTLQVQDGVTRLPEQLELVNFLSNEINTQGNLLVSGETTGLGALVSNGDGTLFLTGTGNHLGGTRVTAGSLVVANTQASPTGPGNVTVEGTGTFGGFGIVDGSLLAFDGNVAPGVSETITGETVPAIVDGVVDAIEFDFTGVQDDAPLTQTSTLANGLQLVSGLDFGSGVNPRNAVNDGNEFNVAGFRADTNLEAASNNGDYLTFTIKPAEGLAMIIEDVSFDLRRNGTGAATNYMINTSIDGFSFDDRLNFTFIDSSNTSRRTFTGTNSNPAPVSDEVEIRIVGAGAASGFGNTHFYAASVTASFISDPNGIAFDPTGIIEIGGDYGQLPNATLKIDLEGDQPGEHDQLQVAGSVTLNGTLDVSAINGFEPTAGQTFEIITADSVSGAFSNIVLADGLDLNVVYSDSSVSLEVAAGGLLGDVNRDQVVNFFDIAPFIALLSSTTYQFEADINGDGAVNFFDISPFIALLAQ